MHIKQALRSTIFLKATSLIIGFIFWTILSDSFTASRWMTVPVCFYNITGQKIEASEKILIELKGRRSHLRNLDQTTIAVHIDAQLLKVGPNNLPITSDLLFLPASIIVNEIIPHNMLIKVLEGAA